MRFLDYQKVKQAEREKGVELFGTTEQPTELAQQVNPCPNTFGCYFISNTKKQRS